MWWAIVLTEVDSLFQNLQNALMLGLTCPQAQYFDTRCSALPAITLTLGGEAGALEDAASGSMTIMAFHPS